MKIIAWIGALLAVLLLVIVSAAGGAGAQTVVPHDGEHRAYGA